MGSGKSRKRLDLEVRRVKSEDLYLFTPDLLYIIYIIRHLCASMKIVATIYRTNLHLTDVPHLDAIGYRTFHSRCSRFEFYPTQQVCESVREFDKWLPYH